MFSKFKRTTLAILSAFLLPLACTTKKIVLVTNVELDFEQTQVENGFVKEKLPTTLTITPEAFLEEFIYTFKYEVLEGTGRFLYPGDSIVPANTPIVLERSSEEETNFILNLNYEPLSPGTHVVKVIASDNFEKSFPVNLSYNVKDVPVIWEVTSPLSGGEETQPLPINLNFSQKETSKDLKYTVTYRLPEGSGQLFDASGKVIPFGRSFPIIFGAYEYSFLADSKGIANLRFDLTDSNEQKLSTNLPFTITEFVIKDTIAPVFTVKGNPSDFVTELEFGTIYTPGTIDNIIDQNPTQLEILGVETINTNQPGSYTVIYTVTDQSSNQNQTTIIETVVVGPENIVPTAVISVAPGTSGIAPYTVTLDGTDSSDPEDGGTLDYLWEFKNGNKSANSSLTLTFDNIKAHEVTLTVTDSKGLRNQATVIINVAENNPPSFVVNGNTNNFTTTLNAGEIYNLRSIDNVLDENVNTVQESITGAINLNTKALCFEDSGKTITYTVTDEKNVSRTLKETIVVVDDERPTLRLNDKATEELFKTEQYTKRTYTAKDNDPCINESSVSISLSSVNFEKSGTYPVLYSMQDANGLLATDTHNIQIINRAPDAKNINKEIVKGIDYTFNINELASDLDPNDDLIITDLEQNLFTNRAIISQDGKSVIYYAGITTYEFTFTVSDQDGGSNTGVVNIVEK